MTSWPGYQLHMKALEEADGRISAAPDDLEAHFDRARMLTLLGRTEEARLAYFEILTRAPGHFGALNNLGILLNSMGFRTAARTAYGEAVRLHPSEPTGRVNLANLLRDEGEFDAARAQYEEVFRLDPDHTEAHKGMALLLLEGGDEDAARVHQAAGFRNGAVTTLPYVGQNEPIPVLLVISAAKGNAPFQKMLDNRVFLVTVIVAEFFDDSQPLPPHRLLVNAIGDADLCGQALRSAVRIVARTRAPVINPPSAVLRTGREDNAIRLAAIPGLVAPATRTFPRKVLEGPGALELLQDHGFSFPLLLRPPGFHTGLHFKRIEHGAGLASILAELPGKRLTAIQHLDASGPDGKIRKYRTMMIGGKLYPAHAAVSRHWKVHYFSADMAGNPEHRSEDEAFLENMEGVLGARAIRTLKDVQDALGLDYAGIDFGLDAKGNVLLFEANAAMNVNPPEPGPLWSYRGEPVARLLDAVRRLMAG